MSVERTSFGFLPDGREVYQYTVENRRGARVRLLTLGASVRSIEVPDAAGDLRDVALGFDTAAEYLEKSDYQGAAVGPFCNRIGGAAFEIDGVRYPLTANEKGITCLHSGGEFSFGLWNAIVTDADSVEFSFRHTDGENGFPGNIDVTVRYRFDDENRLSIAYDAVSDAKTYINLTNHTYFNLNGYRGGAITGHVLTLESDLFTPVDENSIPLGGELPVKDSPFDFTAPTAIGDRIDLPDAQLLRTGGYDHNFAVRGWDGTLRRAAFVSSPESGISLETLTTLPAVQFYAGNFLNGAAGKNGIPMEKRTGFCLETQYYPDSPHRPEFPACLFEAGARYRSETVYAFHVSDT